MRSSWTTCFTSICLVLAASCGGGTEPEVTDLSDFITGVSTTSGNITAQFHNGQAPTGGSGPAVNAAGSSALILGGSSIRTLSATTAFNRVIIAVDGVEGYWELTLPGSVTAQDIILSVGQDVPENSFTVEYAAGTSAGIGAPDVEFVSVVQVGTGDIQVSVSWNVESDVDLHVVEPNGEEIYYGNDVSNSGGTLDLDSNAACGIDGKKNENITWPTQAPPRGTYTVRVDYWDSCGVTSTNYVVTIRVAGRAAQTFTGTLTGEGTNGGEGSGITIASFTY